MDVDELVTLGVGEFAQLVVPAGLERVGDEPVGRVHGEVAAPGGVGGVLGAGHAGGADLVGVLGVLRQLLVAQRFSC